MFVVCVIVIWVIVVCTSVEVIIGSHIGIAV